MIGLLCLSVAHSQAPGVPLDMHSEDPFVVSRSALRPDLVQAAADSFFLDALPEAVWPALVRAYERLGIPATVSERAGGQMGNLQFRPRRNRIGRDRLSRYVDCGAGVLGANADHYDVTLSLVSTIRRHGENGTLLFTQLTGAGKPKSTRGDEVGCATKRALERQIGTLVVEAVRARSDSAGGGEAPPRVGRGSGAQAVNLRVMPPRMVAARERKAL